MKIFCFLVFLLVPYTYYTQELPIAYTIEERSKANFLLMRQDTFVNTGWFPYIFLNSSFDSLLTNKQLELKKQNLNFIEKIYNRSFYQVNENDFVLHINPILGFEFTKDSEHPYTENTRGIIVSGKLSNKISFVSGATETQAFYPDYVIRYRTTNMVLPGSGRVRPFKQNGYDFSKSFGYLTFSPSKNWHLFFGHNRHFVGYGYRSLFLSDATLEYPMFQFRYLNKRWQYIASYATFQSATAYDDRTKVFSRKYSSMHYLSYLIHKKFEVGFFENTLFQPMSLQKNRPPEEYFIPIIFSHSLIYGFNHRRNVMTGIQSQWSVFPFMQLYGQLAIDDYSRTDATRRKMAWQYGLKIFEPFKIKNLFMLVEYNKSTPKTYSNSREFSVFSQHNEPIAHTLGNNFEEYVYSAYYSYKLWFLFAKVNMATYCEKDKRLLVNDLSPLNKVVNVKIETGFILNKPSRLNLVFGVHQRESDFPDYFRYIYVALRTNYFNFYDDF